MWVGKMNEKLSFLNTYSTIEVLLQTLLKVMLSFDSTLGCETWYTVNHLRQLPWAQWVWMEKVFLPSPLTLIAGEQKQSWL